MKVLLFNLAKMVGDSGGLAKVACDFANAMLKFNHEVFLIYSDDKKGDFFFPIDKAVKIYDLRHFRGENIKFPLSFKIRREFLRKINIRRARAVNDDFAKKYLLKNLSLLLNEISADVIVAFQPAASKLLLCDLNVIAPVVTMSHGDPEDYFHTYPEEELPALSKSTVCQVLTPQFALKLKNHLPDVQVEVIGNVVPQYEEQAKLNCEKEFYRVLTVGRLVKNHKRPHLLIEAFIKLADKFPNWQLELWGDKDNKFYYDNLVQMIQSKNLSDRIFLRGVTRDVKSVLAKGDIFVLPSAYEGFGLSLAEAMSMGLPVIGYKNCTAVNELIVDSVNGFLCDDGADALAEKLEILMSERELRVNFGAAARESVKKYDCHTIWNTWNELLISLRKKNKLSL